jgi:primosomal protein N' (replication factor Y)
MYAEVLVQYGSKSLDRVFTYKVPESLIDKIKVGMKVSIPFGNQSINGFVLNLTNNTSLDNLKEIKDIISENYYLNDELIELGKYIKSKTLCSLITAYQTMMPSSLKVNKSKSDYSKYENFIKLIDDEEKINNYIESHSRAHAQIEIINSLRNKVLLKSDFNSSIVKRLIEEGIVLEEKRHKYRINPSDKKNNDVILNDEQEKASNEIKMHLNEYITYLLYGVTGSGKTEVYMDLCDEVIKNDKNIIMLLPEITLTRQMIQRFYDRFGNDVAIIHSSLSDGEKYDETLKIINNEVHVVVGTRSAIFSQVKNLGLIIIDEEHSQSYKQDTNPRYHALDIAKWRCERNKCPLVLGSATPSLESFARAEKGVYKLLTLTKRNGNAKLPKISIIDMRDEFRKGNNIISTDLGIKIDNVLRKKEQVMLFINRRGYSTVINCSSCGYTYKCPHCDITLTYHKTTNKLQCHYCGYTTFKTDVCPECHEKAIMSYGLGTEQVEDFIKTQFPSARVVRMDLDTTSRKGSTESIIKQIENHDVDIIIGTQMISKGLDFPNVTLVGVINADDSLNIPDFRSGENTFSLISQVSGRAGRSEKSGEVVIQTFNKDVDTLKYIEKNDYIGNYKSEMKIRKILKYPPYYFITSVKVKSKNYELLKNEVNKIATFIRTHIDSNSICLGPTTCPVFKVNNVFRFQIIIKYKRDSSLENTLRYLDEQYALNKDISLEIDVDPIRI